MVDKLPTSTGDRRISEPSTVGSNWVHIGHQVGQRVDNGDASLLPSAISGFGLWVWSVYLNTEPHKVFGALRDETYATIFIQKNPKHVFLWSEY